MEDILLNKGVTYYFEDFLFVKKTKERKKYEFRELWSYSKKINS